MIFGVLLSFYSSFSTAGIDNCSFLSYLKLGRLYAFHELLKLTTVAFRAIKILSTVRADILVNCLFQSLQDPVNCQS